MIRSPQLLASEITGTARTQGQTDDEHVTSTGCQMDARTRPPATSDRLQPPRVNALRASCQRQNALRGEVGPPALPNMCTSAAERAVGPTTRARRQRLS